MTVWTLEPGEIEESVDEFLEPRDAPIGDLHQLPARLQLELAVLAQEEAQPHHDRRERRAQLVDHEPEELLSLALEPLALGQVGQEDDDGLDAARRRHPRVDEAVEDRTVLADEIGLVVLGRGLAGDATLVVVRHLFETRRREDAGVVPADDLLERVPEGLREGRIHVVDPLVADEEQGVAHILQELAVPLLAPREALRCPQEVPEELRRAAAHDGDRLPRHGMELAGEVGIPRRVDDEVEGTFVEEDADAVGDGEPHRARDFEARGAGIPIDDPDEVDLRVSLQDVEERRASPAGAHEKRIQRHASTSKKTCDLRPATSVGSLRADPLGARRGSAGHRVPLERHPRSCRISEFRRGSFAWKPPAGGGATGRDEPVSGKKRLLWIDDDKDLISVGRVALEAEGFDVARKLREEAATADVPILMLTSINRPNLPYRYGPDETWNPVDAFLDKPITPPALTEAVKDLLKKSTA